MEGCDAVGEVGSMVVERWMVGRWVVDVVEECMDGVEVWGLVVGDMVLV